MFVIEVLKWDTPNGVAFRVRHDVRGFEQAVRKGWTRPVEVPKKKAV